MLIRFYKSDILSLQKLHLSSTDKKRVKEYPNLLRNPSFIISRQLLSLQNATLFCLSHKGNAAVMLCGVECGGIDMELLKNRDFDAVVDFCFDECERRYYDSFCGSEKMLAFYAIYTAKEAMLKARNLGFDSLRQVSFFDSEFVKYYILIDDFIICVVKRVKARFQESIRLF